MRKILVLVLMIVAIGVAVSGYSWALVNNEVSAARVSTDTALLAVSEGDGSGNTHIVSYINDRGELKMDFRMGRGGQGYGFQDKSQYTFSRVVKVTNNAKEAMQVTARHDQTNDADTCGLANILYQKPTDVDPRPFGSTLPTLVSGESLQLTFEFNNQQTTFAQRPCDFRVQLESNVVQQ